MKPGVDLAITGVLPQAAAVSNAVVRASSEVARPVTISTRRISGAGLKKCIPTRRSGRLSAAPMAVTDRDEVFDARMQSSGTTASSSAKTACLTSSRSTMASIAKPDGARSARAVTGSILPRIAALPGGSSRPFSTERSRNCSMPANPFATAVSSASNIRTRWPCAAATWAMPAPIVPAPITETVALSGSEVMFRPSVRA